MKDRTLGQIVIVCLWLWGTVVLTLLVRWLRGAM